MHSMVSLSSKHISVCVGGGEGGICNYAFVDTSFTCTYTTCRCTAIKHAWLCTYYCMSKVCVCVCVCGGGGGGGDV